jgi:hypothetical protein
MLDVHLFISHSPTTLCTMPYALCLIHSEFPNPKSQIERSPPFIVLFSGIYSKNPSFSVLFGGCFRNRENIRSTYTR